MMNNDSLLISEIKLKVIKLLNQNKILVEKHNNLQNEINILKKTVENQKNSIEHLEDNNKIVKLANEMQLSDLDKKKLKNDLTEKIKQIDECIKMLSQ
ncbi:MAG: hypothetical protein WCI53_05470 [Bacteroidota bacterium]